MERGTGGEVRSERGTGGEVEPERGLGRDGDDGKGERDLEKRGAERERRKRVPPLHMVERGTRGEDCVNERGLG